MCVLWLAELGSEKEVLEKYQTEYGEAPPHQQRIGEWTRKLKETGSLLHNMKGIVGRKPTAAATVDVINQTFRRSPRLSVRRGALRLGMNRETVHRALKKRLGLKPYKLQLLHRIKPMDRPQRYDFAVAMLHVIDRDPTFLKKFTFSDECTFRVSGHVNRHNVRIWARENPHEFVEHVRGSPKVNVWCGMAHDRIIGPFFFNEPTVNRFNYLDMIECYATPQILGEGNETAIFQQDGAPPHYANITREYLNETFPERWVGRGGEKGWKAWPPRSPDLTPLDFFFWGYVKDKVYQVKIRDLTHLVERVTSAIESIPQSMISKVWREVEYRLDVCRATNGGHIELR